MSGSKTDINLLFGILALHLDFVDREGLVSAMNEWILDKRRPLGDLLMEKAGLSAEQHKLLAPLVAEHLKHHENNFEKSLAAISSLRSVRLELRDLGDAEVERTMNGIAVEESEYDPDATLNFQAKLRHTGCERFLAIRRHARGGLGEVWVAADQELHRQVALKQMREHLANDPQARPRFLLEAEITGGLEHPGIVPVYGLGEDSEGRPYYAMKFVRGHNLKHEIDDLHSSRINEAASDRSVRLRTLLGRFIQVCYAVQYAHSRGVVHRDIKPSNIMLGKFGEALVVDWGLAKIVGRSGEHVDSSETTLRPRISGSQDTRVGRAVGTPAYMSPEQAEKRPEHMGPASDVYSLGATLYCMLTGRPPFDEEQLDVDGLAGGRGEYASPWRRGINPPLPRQLNADIGLDLQALCLKAMAYEPADRYSTPEALAQDLERWLADEPVTARRETRSERVARWMRRHRTWVQSAAAASILVIVTLLVSASAINAARLREKQSKHRALANMRLAKKAVDEWTIGPAEDLRYWADPAVQQIRQHLLRHSIDAYDAFARQVDDDRDIEVERGKTLLRLGDLLLERGQMQRAKEAYDQAERVFSTCLRNKDSDREARMQLANTQTRQASCLAKTGQVRDADWSYLVAIRSLRELVRSDQAQLGYVEALAASLLQRGLLLSQLGKTDESIAVLRESMGEFERMIAEDPRASRYIQGLNDARNALGSVLVDVGRIAEAEATFRAAVANIDRLPRTHQDNPDIRESRATGRLFLADVLEHGGNVDDALTAYQEAQEDYQTLLEAFPLVVRYRENLALAKTNRATLLYRSGHTAQAVQQLHGQSLPDLLRLAEDYPLFPKYQEHYAAGQSSLGEMLGILGLFEEAEKAFAIAIPILQGLIEDHKSAPVPDYIERGALSIFHHGLLKQRIGLNAEAERSIRLAVEFFANQLIREHGQKPRYLNQLALLQVHLGELLLETGERPEAEQSFQSAQTNWEQLETNHPQPEYLHEFAWFLVSCADDAFHRPDKAIRLAENIRDQVPRNADYWSTLGAAYYRAGDWKKAATTLRDAIGRRQQPQARDLFFLAMAQWRLGQKDEAQESHEGGLRWLSENRPEDRQLKRISTEVAGLFSGVEE